VCLAVTDFSAEEKVSGVKFCTAVHQHPRQGISCFGELCCLRSPKSDKSSMSCADLSDRDAMFVEYHVACGHRDICGYMAIPEDGRTCYFLF